MANRSTLSEFVQRTTAPPVPEQRPLNPNQPCRPRTNPPSFANPSTLGFEATLPVSFEYARQVAERSYLTHQARPCGASSTPVGPAEQVEGQIQGELRILARWARLRDQTLPPLTVGDLESDPLGVADRYGVKGMSVLTSFINMENFSCRVCSFTAETVEVALLHQERMLHFQT